MIQINTRIKKIRRDAKLTQEQFGARIGITGASCSTIESGKSNPSSQTVKSICREFGIREEWLRTGKNPMYALPENEVATYVDQLLHDAENPLYDIIRAIMKTYSELDGNSQAVIRNTIEQFQENLKKEGRG